MVVNQKKLAQILGVSDRWIRKLKDEGFFQQTENSNGYELEKCVPEYIDYKIRAEVNRGSSADYDKEHAENEKIKKEINKLKLRKLKGETHEAADVEFFLSEMLVNFKNRLLSIPAKAAVSIVGEEDINKIIEVLQKEIIESLEELSEYDPDEINNEETYQEEKLEPEEEPAEDEWETNIEEN